MTAVKVHITLPPETVRRVDARIARGTFRNRNHAVRVALKEKLDRLFAERLRAECAKLNPAEEKRLAEEGMAADMERW